MRRWYSEKIEFCHDVRKRKDQRMSKALRFGCRIGDPLTFTGNRVCILGALQGRKGGPPRPRACGTCRTPYFHGGITEKTPNQSERIEQNPIVCQYAHGPYTQTPSPVPPSGKTDLWVDGCTTWGTKVNPCYGNLNTSQVGCQSL